MKKENPNKFITIVLVAYKKNKKKITIIKLQKKKKYFVLVEWVLPMDSTK